MGNSLDYHNRWLRSDWVQFFESHGYTVETRTVIPNSPDLVQTTRSALAPAFRGAPDSDLESLVTHFVVRRP
jgi:alanyl-tRNA synthetase